MTKESYFKVDFFFILMKADLKMSSFVYPKGKAFIIQLLTVTSNILMITSPKGIVEKDATIFSVLTNELKVVSFYNRDGWSARQRRGYGSK